MTSRRTLLALMLGLCWLGGCFKAPDVIIVDRRTALEEQALGKRPRLEAELQQAGLSARPAPFTRQQLEKSGWRPDAAHDAIAKLHAEAATDSERADQLLERRCIGEGLDGLLADTRRMCGGGVDAAEVAHLIERVNRNRRQVWSFVAQQRRSSVAAARKAWIEAHKVEIACGAHVQTAAGWSVKQCGR